VPDAGVRPARADDADAIGSVQARAWAEAYAELLPADARESLAPQSLAASWRAAITDPPSARHRVLVATAGPTVVGFAASSPSGDADAEADRDGELLVLLVDPGHARAGHGSRLLNATADLAREAGFAVLRCWVPEPDAVRLAFLTGAGFAPDGATRVLDASGDGTATVREQRLSAALGG
jgi:GNAT superfamily N-acetyltransferase